MKTRYAVLSIGVLALALAAPVSAHERVVHVVPTPPLSGSVTLWGGGYGPVGWTGSLSFGTPVVRVPVYPAQVVAVPPGWRQAPGHHRPHRARGHSYARAWSKGYEEGQRDAIRNDRRRVYYD